MRIVRLANFVAPHSGGLRASLAELGAGYLAAGHEPVLVIPGERDGDELTAQGRVITLRAPRVPFTGGYRVLWRRRRLARLLAGLRPDALEVSDRTTLRWTGAWAREHGVPAVMVSHESVTALLKLTRLGPARAVRAVLARPEPARRAAARARAEQYDWGTAVHGFLAAHGASGGFGPPRGGSGGRVAPGKEGATTALEPRRAG
jgi:alpha-1,6-mannosyltransferase